MKYLKLFESTEEKLWDHSQWYINRENGMISDNNNEYKVYPFDKKDVTYITRALGLFKANPKKNLVVEPMYLSDGDSENNKFKDCSIYITGVRHSINIYKTEDKYYYVERTFPSDRLGSYNSYYKYKCDTVEGVIQLFKNEIFKKWKPRLGLNDIKSSVISIISTLDDDQLNRIKNILDNGEF